MQLVQKVFNARTGKEVKDCNECNTSRHCKRGSTVQFRTDLKSMTNKTAKTIVEQTQKQCNKKGKQENGTQDDNN